MRTLARLAATLSGALAIVASFAVGTHVGQTHVAYDQPPNVAQTAPQPQRGPSLAGWYDATEYGHPGCLVSGDDTYVACPGGKVIASPRAAWQTATALPGWQPVSPRLARQLAASDERPGTTPADWRACRIDYGDTTVIACPDGYVTTS